MSTAEGPATRVISLLRRGFQAVEAEKGERLRPVGMRAAHYSLMINVAMEPGLSGAVLARRLGVTPQNVATLVSRLEGSGLLARRTHPRHAHVQEVYLTPEGERAISSADEVVRQMEADVTGLLGPEDTAHLRRILDHLASELPRTKSARGTAGPGGQAVDPSESRPGLGS